MLCDVEVCGGVAGELQLGECGVVDVPTEEVIVASQKDHDVRHAQVVESRILQRLFSSTSS